ncbi:MAG TPA: hypothetical protein VGZ47_21255 [Gemmataceae bacterium]|jgi:hypothetical protein|nr:hypothetical protein [Gemmataceae bacterium]
MPRRNRQFLLLLLATAVLAPLGGIALSAVTTDDVETNRRVLQEIRANNPEYFVRLHRRYEHFHALPAEEQERVRQLDRDLFEKEPQTQAHLLRGLEEYVAWLTRMGEADRQHVLSTRFGEERLKVIQELRLQQWVNHLPAAQREELKAEPEDKRLASMEKWRRDEIAWRQDWTDIRHYTDILKYKGPKLPFRNEKFRAEVHAFVDKRLKSMLSSQELVLLQIAAEDLQDPDSPAFKWFRTVYWLADKHPVLGLEPRYQSLANLPRDYQGILAKMPAVQNRLQSKEGKWPDYPLEVTAVVHKRAEKGKDFKEPKEQLGPSKPEDFPLAVQNFIHASLETALKDPAEKDKLTKAQGHWPEYPLALEELARKHNLSIPELMLPGSPQQWELFRQIGRPNTADK